MHRESCAGSRIRREAEAGLRRLVKRVLGIVAAILGPLLFAAFLILAVPGEDPPAERFLNLWVYLRPPGVARVSDPDTAIIADLEDVIRRKMENPQIVGLAVALVRPSGVVWAKGYGMADREERTPLTPDSPLLAGSLSKIVTTAALLRLRETHGLDLDADLNTILRRAEVPNRYGDGYPVTLRGILSHSSGLVGFDASLDPRHALRAAVPIREDGSLLQAILARGKLGMAYPPGLATWYEPFSTYGAYRRGAYSSIGFTLLGAVIEEVSGQPFDEFVRRQILDPVGMNASTFRATRPTVSYSSLVPRFDRLELDPGTSLRTTVGDLALFAQMLVNRGVSASGVRCLESASVREMSQATGTVSGVVDFGLGMIVKDAGDSPRMWMNGVMAGFRTIVVTYPEDGIASVVTTNSGFHINDLMDVANVALETR